MSERMLFCLGEGKYANYGEGYQKNNRVFNVQVTEDEWAKANNSRPSFELPLAKWIDKDDMTDEEKKNYKIYKEIGGYLKVLSYQDAWKEGWSKASDEFKKWVKDLPHFDAKIFKEITGLDIEETLIGSIAEVKIGGKTYKAKIIE